MPKIFNSLCLIFYFCLLLGIESIHAECLSIPGNDLTSTFESSYNFEILEQSDEFSETILKLRKYTIILVPGIDFDLAQELYSGPGWGFLRRKIYHLFEMRGHLRDYKDFFTKNQIAYKTIQVDDKQYALQPDKIDKIIDQIKNTQGEILFFAHSKGGIDLEEILLRFLNSSNLSDKQELAKIKGAIFLQVPFQGSPFADIFIEGKGFFLSLFRTFIKNLFSKTSGLALEFSLPFRKTFNETNAVKLHDLKQRMNFLSFSSYVPRGSNNFRYLFFALSRNAIFDRYKIDNDGIVPCGSAFVGSNFIIQNNIGHVRTIRKATIFGKKNDINRKKLFYALAKVWFDQERLR